LCEKKKDYARVLVGAAATAFFPFLFSFTTPTDQWASNPSIGDFTLESSAPPPQKYQRHLRHKILNRVAIACIILWSF
jgi:hypothetical protein